MTETTTVELINNKAGTNLLLCSGNYNSYDAESDNYIAEIKNRRKYYSEKLIEASKLFVNYQKAQIKGKALIYVVTDEKGVYIYNISQNIETIVNMPLKALDCPMTTDFSKNAKIKKYSYVLPEFMATFIAY
jgi:hypothetical protein